jgi:hypothetical protein
LLGDSRFRFYGLHLLGSLGRTSFLSALGFVLLFLSDFLGVRDVSRISHEFIDASQRPVGRI